MEFNWKKNITTAIISITVTVVGGWLLFYFQNKEPKLQYSFEKILPFESQTEKLTIYHINFENTGNNVADDVYSKISIEPATVKEYRVNTDAPIKIDDTLGTKEIDIKTVSLNPKEKYRVSILATTSTTFPDEPSVKIRAKGISGEKIDKKVEENKDRSPLSILKYLALIATVASTLTLFIRRINDDDKKHRGDQNQIIAYLCGIHGLDRQVDRYLTLPTQTSYWAEMDRLATIAIASKDTSICAQVKEIITDLIEYAGMVRSSAGIGYYNLARLDKFLKDEANCKEHLEKAKKEIPKLLDTRLKLDPLFKEEAKQMTSTKKS
jgi:hypothetical protein